MVYTLASNCNKETRDLHTCTQFKKTKLKQHYGAYRLFNPYQ